MKKINMIFVTLCFLGFGILKVNASSELKVGDNFYDDIDSAINYAIQSDQTIFLQDNFTVQGAIEITEDQKINIDLNQHKLSLNAIRNYGNLKIKNGNLTLLLGNINNYENGSIYLENINNLGQINNYGTAVLNKVSSESTLTMLNNYSAGEMTLNDCELKADYDMLNNYGKLVINSGEYTALASNSLNFLYGETIINGGNFKFNDSNSFFKVNAPAKLTINGGNFEGGEGVEIYCSKAPNKCEGKVQIIINNVTMNLKDEIVNISGLSDYSTEIPEITINNGNFTTTTNSNFVGFYSPGIINIYGGTINAPNSTGYLTNLDSHDTTLNIGKNDGTIVSEKPYLYLPKANLNRKTTNHKLNFYDGTIILNEKMLYLKGIPEGYGDCYENYEGALKATLGNNCSANINNLISNSETQNPKSAQKNIDVENPKTGAFVSIITLFGMGLTGFGLLKIAKKKQKIMKI